MRKIILFGAIAVVALVLIAGYQVSETQNGVKGADSPKQVDATQGETPESEKPEEHDADGEIDLDAVTDTPRVEVASKQPSVMSHVSENYDSAENLAAQWSIEAAQWNRDAGYPTEQEFNAYNGLKVDELVLLAERGDHVAAYRAGIMLAAAGREAEARNLLLDSVADGSIAAAAALRDIYAGWHNVPRDRAESEAWRQVALAMGQPPLATGPLTSDEATLAGHLFGIYWREVNARYLRDHGVTLPFRPFPLPPERPDPDS